MKTPSINLDGDRSHWRLFFAETRDFFPDQFIRSYRGVLIFLMQHPLEFQIVTPRTLSQFHGHTLILPDVQVTSEEERTEYLRKYVEDGRTLVITGEDATEIGSREECDSVWQVPG